MISSIQRFFRREPFDPLKKITDTASEVYQNVIFGVIIVTVMVILFFEYNAYAFAALRLPNYIIIIRIVMSLVAGYTVYTLYNAYNSLRDPAKLLSDTVNDVTN